MLLRERRAWVRFHKILRVNKRKQRLAEHLIVQDAYAGRAYFSDSGRLARFKAIAVRSLEARVLETAGAGLLAMAVFRHVF